jgi:hypothetical protein
VIESAPVATSVAELEEWVREHRVSWETRSRREAPQGERDDPADLELTLLGRYPDGQSPMGGDGCELVYERLLRIALHVLEPVPEAHYRIDPFDAAVHYRAEAGWIPEVELIFVVEAKERDPSDPGQRRQVLAGIESRLTQLGVQRKLWREP